ncbi:hypothetical protein F5Y17DRAFT_197651 [Xylariaceae sp. FL0594]|nr:hypothetical protein F5Y17DRAFT_197651 [Xylariaceae sp. FL0594]
MISMLLVGSLYLVALASWLLGGIIMVYSFSHVRFCMYNVARAQLAHLYRRGVSVSPVAVAGWGQLRTQKSYQECAPVEQDVGKLLVSKVSGPIFLRLVAQPTSPPPDFRCRQSWLEVSSTLFNLAAPSIKRVGVVLIKGHRHCEQPLQ